MVEEVRRQFKEKPGIMDGSETPEYAKCVDIATTASLREVWNLHSSLSGTNRDRCVVRSNCCGGCAHGRSCERPVPCIYILQTVEAHGTTPKKYIEMQGKKKTEAHAIAVVGDLISGDPYKDTAGPALNTVIKLLNTIAIVFVPVFIAILAL